VVPDRGRTQYRTKFVPIRRADSPGIFTGEETMKELIEELQFLASRCEQTWIGNRLLYAIYYLKKFEEKAS
jgi:hypothetical protein